MFHTVWSFRSADRAESNKKLGTLHLSTTLAWERLADIRGLFGTNTLNRRAGRILHAPAFQHVLWPNLTIADYSGPEGDKQLLVPKSAMRLCRLIFNPFQGLVYKPLTETRKETY